jgi:hypothetical protein
MKAKMLLTAGLALAVGAVPVAAQNTNPCSSSNAAIGCSVNVVTSVNVPEILQLNLSATTTNLTAPNAAAFNAGFQDDAGPTATVTANRSWKVTVNSVGSFSGPYAKAASDLKWGTASGVYANAMGTAATLFTGGGTAGMAQQIYYRTLYDWTKDVAGSYAITVVFSITQP